MYSIIAIYLYIIATTLLEELNMNVCIYWV